MGLLDPLINCPARICVGPTDLSTAYPYGGTDLGLVRAVSVSVEAEPYEIVANEWGREVVEVVEGGEIWRISFALRGLSVTALRQVFLTIDGLGEDGWPRVIYPSTTGRDPGRTRAQDAVTVLVVPLDDTNKPVTYFAQAIPKRAARLELPYELRGELTYAVEFVAGRDETGRPAVFHGLLSDLGSILDVLVPSGFGEDFGEDFGEGP